MITLNVRDLGQKTYLDVWQTMKTYAKTRNKTDADELWLVEHPPVYTQGLAGKEEHLLINPNNIPVIQTDRGGQITYHGPGQIVLYPLLNLQRLTINIRTLVCYLEKTIIATLKHYGVDAYGSRQAPGIYVNGDKIASIGIKVSRGFTYHGVAFNVDMDLSPFKNINPCGYQNLKMCQLKDFITQVDFLALKGRLVDDFNKTFEDVFKVNLLKDNGKPIALC